MPKKGKRVREQPLDTSIFCTVDTAIRKIDCSYEYFIASFGDPLTLCECGTEMCCHLHLHDFDDKEHCNTVD